MGLLGDILLAPVTGPVHGFVGVLEAIRDQADAEMPTSQTLRDELVALNARLEQGELSEAEFRVREAELIDDLKQMRAEEAEDREEDDEEEAEP